MPERPEPGSPADWLRYARSDLALARMSASATVLLEKLCYHAQQAAEKSIKAVLIRYEIAFPRTHNLQVLLELLPAMCPVPELVAKSVALTDYAVMSRYPGEYEAVTGDEYREAVRMAEAVLAWAERLIQRSS